MLSLLAELISYVPFLSFLPNIGKILSSVFENVMPFVGQVLTGVTWFVQTMWEGLKDVVDDIRTVLFVLVLIFGTNVYTIYKENVECKAEIVTVTKKLMPKNPVRTVPNNEFKWPWEGLF